jgi:hypothetical protein
VDARDLARLIENAEAREEVTAVVDRLRSAGVKNYGLQLSPAAEPKDIPEWLSASALRPRDRWTKVYRGAEPAPATATRYVITLGVATTLSSARGRGAQGALLAQRIHDGLALGCTWFVTETGEETPERPNPSFRNMIRAGFTVAYHRQNFMPPKP